MIKIKQMLGDEFANNDRFVLSLPKSKEKKENRSDDIVDWLKRFQR